MTALDTTISPACTAAEPGRWGALAVLLLGSFVTVLDVFIVHVAIPSMARELAASAGSIELVVAGYLTSYGVMLVTGGRLGDRFGRKRLFLTGMAAFTLASALCGLAPSAPALVAARIVQGATAALLFPQVLAMIRVGFAGDERRRAFGYMGLVLGLAAIAGQFLGGLLVESNLWGLGWRAVFLMNLPVGLFAIAVGIRKLPESRAPGTMRLDVGGIVLATAGLVLLLVPLATGREAGWPLWTLLSLAAAPVVLALFARHEIRVERRGRPPLLAMRLLRGAFALGIVLVLIYYSTLNAFFLALAVLLQLGLHFSPFAAGSVLTPTAVIFSITSLMAPRAVARFGRRALCGGTLVYAAGLAATAVQILICRDSVTVAALMPAMIVLGAGQGFVHTPIINEVLGSVRTEDAGMASGAIATMQQIGGAVGVAIVGLIFWGVLGSDPARYPEAYAASMMYIVGAALVTAALIMALPRPGAARP
jgi:EmrB/QacA subfamily drug resistance transporter